VPVSADSTLTVVGSDFRELITAVSRFPTIGSFAGSEMISLATNSGKLVASSFGVVLSKASVAVEGELTHIAIDERVIVPFASMCPDVAKVTIELADKKVTIRYKNKEIFVPFAAGVEHKTTPVKNVDGIAITDDLDKKINYLANLAFSDSSRPELCCVMLADKKIAACSPKVVALLTCQSKYDKIAIPLPLAREIKKDDTLYPGEKETLLKSGIGRHYMPSPVAAQSNFPLDTIVGFKKLIANPAIECNGQKLMTTIAECYSVLGSVARTEIPLHFSLVKGKLELIAENGGARFRAAITIKAAHVDSYEFVLPMEEMQQAAPLLPETLHISKGKNNETFLSFDDGWLMLPSYQESKKK
jgi:hypothetical protein